MTKISDAEKGKSKKEGKLIVGNIKKMNKLTRNFYFEM